MAQPIVRLCDIASGHGCFPPHKPVMASSTVYCDNQPVVRRGDLYEPHCCPNNGCHIGLANGVSTVFIENMPAQKVGDMVGCGSMMVQGSPTVYIG